MAETFSGKETAAIIGIASSAKASQAMNPAWEKVAKHARHDLKRTMQIIFEHIERLEPMSDREIFIREQMLQGTLDREVVHPHRNGK